MEAHDRLEYVARMGLARWIYLVAGVYGVLILAPGFFTERAFGAMNPPPPNHPELYYGFYGSALVWQVVFLMIARDPARLRILMPVTMLEKLAFFAPCVALYATGRLPVNGPFIGGMIDGVLLLLFFVAWRASAPAKA